MSLKSLGGSADHIQSGSEKDRPKPAVQGEVRFNTDSEDFEIWEGTRWVSMRPPVDGPITDNNRVLGLAIGRGLQAPEDILEAYLGKDLGFDNQGKIEYQGEVPWSELPACPGGGLVWADKCWTLAEDVVNNLIDYSEFPACPGGGLVWANKCWTLDKDVVNDLVDPPAAVHWDDVAGKPDCFPACGDGNDGNNNNGNVDWSDIKNKPDCFPACGDGDGATVCINKDETNLQFDEDGCLEFTQLDDGDDDWPSFTARMYGHIAPKGDKSDGIAEVTYASPGPNGNPCVSVNATAFPQVDGENNAWEIDLKFSKQLKTDRYEVFLTPGDGSYDHCMTYLKDNNAKNGFKVYMHDLENNVALNGDNKRADSNHVAAFSFMVLF